MTFPASRVFLGALALALWAWALIQWGDLPLLAEYHDSGIYFIGAKSLAAGDGYRLLHLPGHPAQTKYPPGLSAWLAPAWWFGGSFPGNLRWAAALCALWLPPLAALFWLWLGRAGVAGWRRDAAVFLLAVNPYTLVFGLSMLSEVPFTVLVLGSWLLLERNRPAAAGVVAAAAYLFRTAGIALLPAGVLWLLWRRQGLRSAAIFSLILLPVVAAWMIWSRANLTPGSNFATIYYTDYLGFHLLNFEFGQAHLFLWKNLDGLLHGLGSLLLPKTGVSLLQKIAAQCLAVAGIVGAVRAMLRGNEAARGFGLFAFFYAAQLLVWHFPPNERFLYPVFPLLVLGWIEEFGRLADAINRQRRNPDAGQRTAAWVLTAAALILAAFCLAAQWQTLAVDLPLAMHHHRERRAGLEPLFQVIRGKVDGPILSGRDPLVYLATGRESVGLIVTTPPWYHSNWEARRAEYSRAADYAREHGLRWLLLDDEDYLRDMDPRQHELLLQELKADPRLHLVARHGPAALYRIVAP